MRGLVLAIARASSHIPEQELSRHGRKQIPQVIQPQVRYDISDENRTYRMYTEYVAVEVESFERMVGFTIPPRTYARFTHVGPISQVRDTYTRLFLWLDKQGLAVDETALRMERYDERCIPSVHAASRPENAFDNFIPLRDLPADRAD